MKEIPLVREKKLIQQLDSIRGIAALLIVVMHCMHFPPILPLDLFLKRADLMVDVFFTLSGFVMCINYEGRISCGEDVKKFISARFARVYPLYFLALIVALTLTLSKAVTASHGICLGKEPLPVHEVLVQSILELFLLQPLNPDGNLVHAPGWSIAAEFYIYILFAFALFLGARNKAKNENVFENKLMILLLGVSLGANFWLYHGPFSFGEKLPTWGVVRAVYGFCCGALVYSFFKDTLRQKLNGLGLFFFAALFFVIIGDTYGRIFVPPLSAFLLLTILNEGDFLARVLKLGWLVFLGKCSFSIYMTHYAVQRTLLANFIIGILHGGAAFGGSMSVALLTLLAYLLIVVLISFLVLKYIEIPARRRLRGFLMHD